MKSTCIQHPTNEPLLIIRRWQLDFCEDNHCAAALLSFFEYWHNLRLEINQRGTANRNAQPHGNPAAQDENLLQFHSDEQLQAGLLNLYGTMKIRESRRLLIAKGALTEHSNPKPRYAFDRTVYYRFHPEAVNAWLEQRHKSYNRNINVTCAENGGRVAENGGRVAENGGRVAENGDCSSETTTEVSTEITTTTPNPSSSNERRTKASSARSGSSSNKQDQNLERQDHDHGITTKEPTKEKTVSQGEVQPTSTTGTDGNTAIETPKTVSQEEGHDDQQPELVYPAKLTRQEHADINGQIKLLPPRIAQQMLDVLESRMQSGQIRTNPAALLRGVIRKYQANPADFDPSPGFQIAEQRRRRAEAEAQLHTAARRPLTVKTITQSQQQGLEQQRAALETLSKAFRQQQAAQVEARLAAMTGQERAAFDQAFTRANPIWAKSYRDAGLASPMLRAAFQTFAAPRLLTAEQQDLLVFARAQGASLEILNLLQLAA